MTSTEDETEVSYTIGFAKAELEGLFADSFERAIRGSWVPGAEVTRYGRQWTLSKMLSFDKSAVYGKIGFVDTDQLDTLFFDRDKFDFVRGQAPSGIVVPFIISRDFLVSYQLIGETVKESTFINALEALLNAGNSQFYSWDIKPLTFEVSYEAWRENVETVTRFELRLERPNPNYHGDKIAEDLVEGLMAEYVRLSGVARDEANGIDTDSDIFQQALDHVLRNYGNAKLVGVDSQGDQSVFLKMRNAVSRLSTKVRVSVPGGGPEVPEEALRAAREKLPVSALPARDAEAGG